MAGSCAFDVDENVPARSSNVARPPARGGRNVAAGLCRLGNDVGVAGVEERPVRRWRVRA